MSKTQHPHDRFFRQSFSRPEIIQGFLKAYVPTSLGSLIDLDSLTLLDGSFIDERWRKHQSDLLYQAQLTTGENLTIYLLLEHKSKPEAEVGLQLLRYMVRIWERQQTKKQPLRPILPFVIHHGEQSWHHSTTFTDLLTPFPETIRPYLPNFQYHLTDFSYQSSQQIIGNQWIQAYGQVVRGILNPDLEIQLLDILCIVFELEQFELGVAYIRQILYYLHNATGKVAYETLAENVEQVSEKGAQIMQTIADQLIQQGVEQGEQNRARQIAKQLLQKGFSLQEVSELTGLSLDEVTVINQTNQEA